MEEIRFIINKMQETFDGEPWFGKSVLQILSAFHPANVYMKPCENGHSAMDLLYHMINWEEFTLHQLEESISDPSRYETQDWRDIDPQIHNWKDGISTLTYIHRRIIENLENAPAGLLERKAKFRDYDMRVLLYGVIDHNIYHTGQLAFLMKSLGT